MRAVVHDRFGGPEVLRVADLDEPKTHVDSVLVRVKAAGLNPADLAIRAGALAGSVESYFPVVPGWDVAGVVVRAGPGAPEFAPGDEVVGYVRGEVAHRNGGYAELVAADVRALARKPRNADWRQAAALPCPGSPATRRSASWECPPARCCWCTVPPAAPGRWPPRSRWPGEPG
jgi:NADPH:quinone reductase-like Zn-dependent oxidoreductase